MRLKIEDIEKRLSTLYNLLDPCMLCPRKCGAKRLSGETGLCGGGFYPSVSACLAHHGEEPPFSGSKGSGTVFFTGCSLGCVFCQNYQISRPQAVKSNEISVEKLATYFIELQKSGCHNLNLVTPTHFSAQIVKALIIAISNGFSLPVIWNSSGYESVEIINLLDGIVDIWLPDFKYMDPKAATLGSSAPDYPLVAQNAVSTMFTISGPLVTDDDGIAVSGLCVRHLVLPENLSGSFEFLEWYAPFLADGAGISLMSQFNPPAGMPQSFARSVTSDEYYPVAFELKCLNPEYAFIQDLTSTNVFNPDFETTEVFDQAEFLLSNSDTKEVNLEKPFKK
ncbi:radical SAM protein [Myxococcota bacterium]|nr:radical SAM protein [Myxococcota bacterium]MBU1379851.1 radical SAM protein [Myxococcota bacterium]MBU1496060.1 radical SAM protein [Myxococcota bacterium]